MAEELMAEIDEFNSKAQSSILDSLSHRSLVAAFRRACLIYAANGMKWESTIPDYCRWSMQVDMYLKYNLFAEDIRKANEGARMSNKGLKSLLDSINANELGVFTFDEVIRVYTASGREPDERRIKNMLSQWKKRGYIDGDFDKGFTKR